MTALQNQGGANSQGITQNTQDVMQNNFLQANTMPANQFTNTPTPSLQLGALTVGEQAIISTIEVEKQADYIKNLLNLPKGFDELIKQIETGNNPNLKAIKTLNKLLVNGKIDLDILSELLKENSKDAINKLMRTIMAVSKMGSNDVAQLKELIKMFSGATSASENAQVAKNLIMLYLPWLPLSVRNEMNLNFTIDIFEKIQGADPNSQEKTEVIKIMIQTLNFGNVMALVETARNNEIDVFISACESFPEEKVMSEFKKETQKNDIRTNLSVEKNKDYKDSEKIKQNIEMVASKFVSPKLILAAHSLIKIIIEVDNTNSVINENNEG